MVSLSSGLLQFVSNLYLVTPNGNGTTVSINQNQMQLLALVNQQAAVSTGESATSPAVSAQLAEDTYTPSAQSQAAKSSSISSDASSSTVTLASLIKNQTISGSEDVRQILSDAIAPLWSVDPEAIAWNDLATKVGTGDFTGAQTALADYGAALVNTHLGDFADVSPIQSDLAALGSALQAGNSTDVQTAFTALTTIAPTHNLGLVVPQITGSIASAAGQMQWAAANMADAFQKLGYTAANAQVEADAWMLGYAADNATIHVSTVGAPSDEISNHPDVDQSITDLAKAAAGSTDKNLLVSILVGMSQANSETAMEATLTQLDSKYGGGSQGTGADNASQAGVSASV